ncbi:N-acetylmuramoyl-L-alanine amidase [Arcobacter sp. FWKO B]|nr:N-acetylmuramoyl-L-alanine amidase [Arcobacter sp. FWKO B]
MDPKFSINAVENNGNDIIIRFNHDITLDDISFSQERGRGTHRDIFDIKGNFKDAQSTVIKIDGIDRVIVNQQAPSVLRVSIVNSYDPNTIYIVNQRTIVLRTFPKTPQTPKETAISSSPAIQKTEFLRARTIVIDPGHGGKDPGAVIGNNHEKTAVLAVGRYLAEHLRTRGYKVLLTRDNDKYLTLKERTEFANHNHADIFISIHANAVDKQNAANARGVETYFLSPARSERAKRLAALENKDEMQSLDLSSQNALLTILNQSRITSSNKLAIDIQKYMLHEARKSHKDTVDGGVREGPFYVLVGAQMPSVLVEIGYITHPIEGKRIFETNYQKQLAKGIANGIDSYFLNNP